MNSLVLLARLLLALPAYVVAPTAGLRAGLVALRYRVSVRCGQPDPDDALWVWSPLDSQEIGPSEILTIASEPNWPALGVGLDRTDLRLHAELDERLHLHNRSTIAQLVEIPFRGDLMSMQMAGREPAGVFLSYLFR